MSSYQRRGRNQHDKRERNPVHRAILCSSRSTEDGTTLYHPSFLQDESEAWLAISPGVAVSRDEIEDIRNPEA